MGVQPQPQFAAPQLPAQEAASEPAAKTAVPQPLQQAALYQPLRVALWRRDTLHHCVISEFQITLETFHSTSSLSILTCKCGSWAASARLLLLSKFITGAGTDCLLASIPVEVIIY